MIAGPAVAQQPIRYIYDDLGRLVGVVDPAADTAVYSYDAVGNLLSIARFASTTVSIIAVSPGSGAVGATVTISGTGFSTTPGQNTVTFNGTAARRNEQRSKPVVHQAAESKSPDQIEHRGNCRTRQTE